MYSSARFWTTLAPTQGAKINKSWHQLVPTASDYFFSIDSLNLEWLGWLQCQSEAADFWWENQLPHQNGAF
jgi:hypothetical protein